MIRNHGGHGGPILLAALFLIIILGVFVVIDALQDNQVREFKEWCETAGGRVSDEMRDTKRYGATVRVTSSSYLCLTPDGRVLGVGP